MRVAIAGCGLIAGAPLRHNKPIATNHARAATEVPGASLVAAYDTDAARATLFGEHWRIPTRFESVPQMCKAMEVDLLVVATPPESHEHVCSSAIESGIKGLLCEKPFTGTSAGAVRVLRAAQAASVPVIVNFTRRWDRSHQAVASRISGGEIGAIRAMQGVYTGTIRGNGSHLVDTMRMLLPGAWSLFAKSPLPPQAVDGPVAFTLAHGDCVAQVAPIVDAEYFVFELYITGTKGRVKLLRGGNEIWLDSPAASVDYPGYRYLDEHLMLSNDTLPDAFTNALSALVDAVLSKDCSAFVAQDNIRTLEFIDQLAAPAAGIKS